MQNVGQISLVASAEICRLDGTLAWPISDTRIIPGRPHCVLVLLFNAAKVGNALETDAVQLHVSKIQDGPVERDGEAFDKANEEACGRCRDVWIEQNDCEHGGKHAGVEGTEHCYTSVPIHTRSRDLAFLHSQNSQQLV